MIPVHQDEFYVKGDLTKGNCFAACVASILELELSEVPNCPDLKTWFSDMDKFVQAFGFSLLLVENSVLLKGYCIASGTSPRADVLHAVVYKDGELVHDPHPSGDGIVGDPVDFAVFVSIDPGVMKYE